MKLFRSSSLINLHIKSHLRFDRYKLAQKEARSIPMGIRVVCNTVRFPASKYHPSAPH